jgi:hypothetical protein
MHRRPFGPPLAKYNHPRQPRAHPAQPATRSIIQARPAFASTRSQHSCHICTQRTTEVQRRQLRHPSEARCQRRCPIISDPIACTHRRPSARPPRRTTPPAPALRAPASAHSTQHHLRIAGIRKHPLTAQLAADARSVPQRYSDVSCVISARLGASDAAPSASILLSTLTTAPRLAPRKPPTTRYNPVRIRPSPQHATSSNAQPAFATTRSQRS